MPGTTELQGSHWSFRFPTDLSEHRSVAKLDEGSFEEHLDRQYSLTAIEGKSEKQYHVFFPLVINKGPSPTPIATPIPPAIATPHPVAPHGARFGVAGVDIPSHSVKPILDSLNTHLYYDYLWNEPFAGAEKIQMVARSYLGETGLNDFIRSHPGQYWQIGNEPNVPNQDNLTPIEYAQEYHRWATRIKVLDPSAKILNGGVGNWPDVLGTPGAVNYIREFRESYRALFGEYPVVDIWSIHAYPPFYESGGKLHSYCDTTEPKRFITEAVRYLRDAGELNPIWLTEFGMDWANDSDPCTATFMIDMVKWLEEANLVSRWYWWSACASCGGDGKGGSLVDPNGNLTVLGQTWRDLASDD